MKPLEDYEQPLLEYELIDWSRPAKPMPPYKPDIRLLTEWEAHEKNRALAMNGTCLRYIKI